MVQILLPPNFVIPYRAETYVADRSRSFTAYHNHNTAYVGWCTDTLIKIYRHLPRVGFVTGYFIISLREVLQTLVWMPWHSLSIVESDNKNNKHLDI